MMRLSMGQRPDPDHLLATARRDDERARRGKLTIFFGSAPGVGKTYAMLEAARAEREAGRDVAVGLVETHGRYDTGALLLGLEILPRARFVHGGTNLDELDLDAVLARRPGLVLVDELAHTNAPGARHTKRWQDVEELLSAGLDVHTTLNVQHVESVNDVVAQVTSVVVRETVPDSVLENADDVRLIDLPLDELLERLRDGKIYLPDRAARARESFFRSGNLIALRELALRITAERVDAQMRAYRKEHGISRTWAVAERLLVCVSPSPASERLVRSARRLATALHADWIAVYVETPASIRLSADARKRVSDHLRLAQSLGAEAITLSGPRGAEEVTRFARSRNVTRIVVGKPTHPSWRDWLTVPFLDRVVRLSADIEVHVLSGAERDPVPPVLPRRRHALEPEGWIAAAVAVGVTTSLGAVLFDADQLADVVMLDLLGIVLVSLRWGLWPSLVAAVLSVFALDYFFIPPLHTLAVTDGSHVTTFAVMFLVAVLISGLTRRVREQGEAAREREIRTASLYSLSGALSRAKTTADVATEGAKHVHDVFGGSVAIMVPGADGRLARIAETEPTPAWRFEPDEKELRVAEWAHDNRRVAGAGTDTLPSASGRYLPLEASDTRVGVLGVEVGTTSADRYDDRQHLAAFAGQIAGALERTRLADKAHKAQLRVEAEQLRNSLLSSVSHDLRTPLAVITGAASTLLEGKLDAETERDLTATILGESELLNRLVRNLLDMTRLEAGAVEVKKEWQSLEEAVGAALERVDRIIAGRTIVTRLPADLPLVPYDSILLQQVLVNLLENAAKYTPVESEIVVMVTLPRPAEIEIEVADNGPGLPPGEEEKIFDKFYRAEKRRGGGVGLGLTICKGIVTAHGGRIWANNRVGGGAAFHFTLPIEGSPPRLETNETTRPEESQHR